MYVRIFTQEWDFRDSNTKDYTHGFHTYPAMMIPQVARKLIENYKPEGKFELLFDPYMGSGTSLVEAAIKGIDSIGTDLNPLARFISKVKTTPINIDVVNQTLLNLNEQINNYSPNNTVYDYSHLTQPEYWYNDVILHKLSYLTEIINLLNKSLIQDFFNLALSELVREASYTRNGEFKRYRIEKKKISVFNIDVFSIFIKKINRNIEGLQAINGIKTYGNVAISDFDTVCEIPESLIEKESVDMVVTSPPYGDSGTTVAYGQFSRWASEWFRFDNAKNIDSLLMGSKKSKNDSFQSKTINQELEKIKEADEKRYYEVISFLEDYKNSMINVARTVRPGGKVCYVVGNRTVKGVQIPLDFFTAEVFENEGFAHNYTYVRSIPNKRMPSITSPSNKKGTNVSTMIAEYIVILTKK